jgi:hypothetical protein
VDVLGPTAIRESFLGDIAIISTFRSGFLFPIAYALSLLKIPITFLYPFGFYFLCMLSFYLLSKEFLNQKYYAAAISILYVINPVTPYYFTSLFSAFVVAILPLSLKFTIKSLRNTKQQLTAPYLNWNLVLAALFLSLSVSAHEQFFLSALIIGAGLMIAFILTFLRNQRKQKHYLISIAINLVACILVFMIVNLPLLISLANVNNAPNSTYFTGRASDFIANVRYTYATTDPITLLRLGGDSGTGLNQTSWYDVNSPLNLLGYSIFAVFIVSVYLLRKKESPREDRTFFYMNVGLFSSAFALLLFMRLLPYNKTLSEMLFSFIIQTWESPAKLRVILLLSALTTSLYAMTKLEKWRITLKRKIIGGITVLILIFTIIGYNSPWVLADFGRTPLEGIADNLKWGPLFDTNYGQLAVSLENQFGAARGIMVPYTQKVQLYMPPNFRIFQLVSGVDEQVIRLCKSPVTSLSKTLGLLSAKYIVLNENLDKNESLIFPRVVDQDFYETFSQLEANGQIESLYHVNNYTVYENNDALPKAYATGYYILYDDIATMKYAFPLIDFQDLPVFISVNSSTGKLKVPEFLEDAEYDLYMVTNPHSEILYPDLNITMGENSRNLTLDRVSETDFATLYSKSVNLHAGETVQKIGGDLSTDIQEIDELILNSTSYSIGEYDSFDLAFKVNVVEWGKHNSFGPRIGIDNGDSGKYFIIFHTDGAIELAVQKGPEFYSGLEVEYADYALKNETSYNVEIEKALDEVSLQINGKQILTFSAGSNASEIIFSSEQSTSRFSEIQVARKEVTQFFAIRKSYSAPNFSLEQVDPNKAVMTITNATSDYIVVLQYLYSPLRHMTSQLESTAITANIFFSGWVMNCTNFQNCSQNLNITTENESVIMGFTVFAILFTYFLLIIEVAPKYVKRTLVSFVLRTLKHVQRIKHKLIGESY